METAIGTTSIQSKAMRKRIISHSFLTFPDKELGGLRHACVDHKSTVVLPGLEAYRPRVDEGPTSVPVKKLDSGWVGLNLKCPPIHFLVSELEKSEKG